MKSGIDACDFDVILNEEIDGHDHDMEYLHGHDHSHTHGAEEHNPVSYTHLDVYKRQETRTAVKQPCLIS